MQTPATISFRNFPRSDAVASRIEEKIRKLEQYYDRIISCRVVVQAPHRHNTKGKLYQVHIHLGLPGDDIVVGKDSAKDHSHEDVYIAVRDSFEALRRQLKKHVRQIRNRHVMDAPDPVYGT
tara:strand:+ start:760 stop:1125 length:366 start_codon:yes stop_codon:yes gene_type:complete